MTEDIHDPEFVASVFDRCAANYRVWSTVSSFGFVLRWRRQCVDAVPAIGAPKPVVVDLMAGTGEIWPVFLRRFAETEKIVAIDISHEMHRQAVEKLHRTRTERIKHLEANFLTNELPEEMADCAISTFGLKTFDREQQAAFARELARILKRGGVFSLIEASDPKGWILRPLYRFYLDRVLPLIERFFLKGAQDFSMLGIYTRTFEDCRYLQECLRREGLDTELRRYFFGCATGISGHKPAS